MSTPSPNFGFDIPNPATPFNKLGAELLKFGMDVDAVLKTFDYDGADPNLVLARVAALEAWRTTATASLTALEAAKLTRQSGVTPNIGNLTASGGSVARQVTFPTPFKSRPMLGALSINTGIVFSFVMWPYNVTATGFEYRVRNMEPVAVNMTAGIVWDAYGELA